MVGLPRGIVTTWDTIAVRLIAYRQFIVFLILFPYCAQSQLLELRTLPSLPSCHSHLLIPK